MSQPFCPACGYDLRGLLGKENVAKCPECGKISPLAQVRRSVGTSAMWIAPLVTGVMCLTALGLCVNQPWHPYRDGTIVVLGYLLGAPAAAILNGTVAAIAIAHVRRENPRDRETKAGNGLLVAGFAMVIAILTMAMALVVVHAAYDPSKPNNGGMLG